MQPMPTSSERPVLQTFQQLLTETSIDKYHPRFASEFRILYAFLEQALNQGYILADVFDGVDCVELEQDTPIAEAMYHLYTSDHTRVYLWKDRQLIAVHVLLQADSRLALGSAVLNMYFCNHPPVIEKPELITTLKLILQQVIQQYPDLPC